MKGRLILKSKVDVVDDVSVGYIGAECAELSAGIDLVSIAPFKDDGRCIIPPRVGPMLDEVRREEMWISYHMKKANGQYPGRFFKPRQVCRSVDSDEVIKKSGPAKFAPAG